MGRSRARPRRGITTHRSTSTISRPTRRTPRDARPRPRRALPSRARRRRRAPRRLLVLRLRTATSYDVGIGLRPELTGHGLGESFLRAQLDYATSQWRPRRPSACSSPPGTGARSGSTSDSASPRSVVRRATSSWWASTSSSRWSARREGSSRSPTSRPPRSRSGGTSSRTSGTTRRPTRARVELFANPARRDAPTRGRRRRRRAVGFFNFVPRGRRGAARARACGPDLTGRGLAQPFIEAGLDYASEEWQPRTLPPLGRVVERARAARLPPRRLRGGRRTARRAAFVEMERPA